LQQVRNQNKDEKEQEQKSDMVRMKKELNDEIHVGYFYYYLNRWEK
jgi:hypothetical protein